MLFLFLAITAYAADDFSLDAIDVRGQKDSRTYLETTESVSKIDEPYLNQAGRENNITVLSGMPNVQVNKNGENFSIRGINNTGATGFQRDNLASILVDDVFQTDLAIAAGSFDLWDSERVELLRGAQSATQGVNSLAGTFLLYHQAPRYYSEGMAKAGVGNFGSRELGAMLNREIEAGKMAARVSYNKEWSRGFVTNAATGDAQGRNKDKAELGITRKVFTESELLVDGKFHRLSEGAPYVTGTNAFADQVDENINFEQISKNYQISARLRSPLSGGWRNEVITAFSSGRQTQVSDTDGEPADRLGTRHDSARDTFVSVENLLKYEANDNKNVLGLHAHSFNLKDDHDFTLPFPLGGGSSTPVDVVQNNNRTRHTVSLFDSYLYRFNELHSVNIGGRLEYVHNKYWVNVDGTSNGNSTANAYLNAVRGAREGNNGNLIFLPKAAYLLDLGANHLAASYTRAYRTGGVSINRRRAVTVDYDPEFTSNYELSYKLPLADFSLAANAFYTDWRRQQVQVQLTNDTFDTQVTNAARSRIFGGEVEARRAFGKQFAILGLGYTNTRFLDFTSGNNSYNGNRFPFAPEYTVRLAHEIRPLKGLTLTTTARLLGKSFTNAENTRRATGQFQLDLNAQYSLGTWLLEGFANNILNRRYITFDGTPSATLANNGYPTAYNRVNSPRELGVRVTFLW